MNDRELLEFTAKAAGYDDATWNSEQKCIETTYLDGFRCWWNPLANDGDALRLAVKLKINLNWRVNINGAFIYANHEPEQDNGDPYAATRRAIVLTAAEIGKEVK